MSGRRSEARVRLSCRLGIVRVQKRSLARVESKTKAAHRVFLQKLSSRTRCLVEKKWDFRGRRPHLPEMQLFSPTFLPSNYLSTQLHHLPTIYRQLVTIDQLLLTESGSLHLNFLIPRGAEALVNEDIFASEVSFAQLTERHSPETLAQNHHIRTRFSYRLSPSPTLSQQHQPQQYRSHRLSPRFLPSTRSF